MADVLASEELVEEPSDFGSMRPGTCLGRYELLVPIARGGMARVWAARLHGQRGFQKVVALKTILPHLASHPEFERMFLDEARIAAAIHHPNVCEIYELGEEQDTLYLAMEWVTGDSLARILRASGKPEAIDARVVARIVADACAGLHAAHELADDSGRPLHVVHRDLSPHNLLLTGDGVTKVADFGVAKALGQLHEETNAGQLKGKIAYMAPEQITGGTIDRRSDIFSLGVVIYEATTGKRPFRGQGDHQVMHAITKGEFPAPSTLVPGYPPELERIVQRALSPQPLVRFPTAERMRFALEEYLAKGSLITQSNVAQLIRQRIGPQLEKRKERIRLASTPAGEREPVSRSEPPGAMTPSNRSGVQSSPSIRPPMSGKMTLAPLSAVHVPSSSGSYPGVAMTPMAPSTATPLAPMVPMPGGGWGPGLTPPPPGAGDVPSVHTLEESSPPSIGTPAPIGPQDPPPVADAPAAGAGQYVLAAGIGLVFAALIGGGAFMVWRAKAPAASAEQPAAKTVVASAEPRPAENAAVLTDIALHVTPADATISVDGHELPAGTLSIPRPARGKTAVLIVRAKDHEELTVMVDTLTNSPLDLVPKASPPPSIELGDDKPTAAAEAADKPADKANAKTSEEKPEEKHAAPASKPEAPAVPAVPVTPKPRGPAKADPALPANPF
ncbi:serine/threonine protein kinase [Labilithrix luteola]|uniref:Serine/threonine protein kinase n=1 Tax=Labilithrix luteola TaxID=1391654 RepID=A0A0K1Q875_9BACT|nr:serine/threonine-protein kinase [Labilithrix luteola]AKV01857.1 serine/threonine protein kinase [Labilithrix luteola]